MLDHNLVLKSDELYLVGEISTDGSGERATGLYVRDTRHLSHFDVTLNGARLDRLMARTLGPASATVTLTNDTLRIPHDEPVLPHTVAVEEHIELGASLRVRFVVRNHSGRRLPLTLELEFASDFRDLFDIRGFARFRRGSVTAPRSHDQQIVLDYVGLDGAHAQTEIRFSRLPTVEIRQPDISTAESEQAVLLPGLDLLTLNPRPRQPPSVQASFPMELESGESWEMVTTVTPRPPSGPDVSEPASASRPRFGAATIMTDGPLLNALLRRSQTDLAMLQTSFPEGSLPAAGIPWYVAPFGRDSLIVGLQTLHLSPDRAAGTLRVLASLQGTEVNAWRAEEPGKILHEMRYGEMTRLGEIPHTPYYGTVDATPLFVLLFAETVAWTGDERLYHDLLPNVRRALEWIERYGDVDGDGFVEYQSGTADGVQIVHQGWKDSHDSLHHTDGRSVSGAIALVEVQSYVYAAYRRLADVVTSTGDTAWAEELRSRAEAIREAVEQAFWLEPERYYAQALDGDKQPVRAISSNPGHLLFCGLPSPDRAAAVADRLAQPDLDSGWGVRTLSSSMPTYNPMSYHNGSVWPHDNSLIAAGLARYGLSAAAHRIVNALVRASATYPLNRLPELYCGFARNSDAASDAPVAYPVSCSPQAWAAGSALLLVKAMLGLDLDLERGTLLVNPAFPEWLTEVDVHGLMVRGLPAAVSVGREDGRFRVTSTGPVASAQVFSAVG